MTISVNVLLYGDYPHLAEKCLGSIIRTADWDRIADVRVGLNDVSYITDAVVLRLLEEVGRRVPTYSYIPERNVGKYPLMRRMFFDPGLPLASHTMWFDDDSFIADDQTTSWWKDTLEFMDSTYADMIGSPYVWKPGFTPTQIDAIKRQPWFRNLAIPRVRWPKFAQGGWWMIRSTILKAWDYPFFEIHHNGGDTMLGELLHQQGYTLVKYRHGVCINWDEGESRAARRGITSPQSFTLPSIDDIHNFTCRTRCHLTLPASFIEAATLPPVVVTEDGDDS